MVNRFFKNLPSGLPFLLFPSLVNKKKVLVRDSPQSQVNSFLFARQNAVLRNLSGSDIREER